MVCTLPQVFILISLLIYNNFKKERGKCISWHYPSQLKFEVGNLVYIDYNIEGLSFIYIFPEVALSPNNHEVHIYQRADSDWKLVDVLNQHDLRVTGIDWAPKTNRIVTCAVVSISVPNEHLVQLH